MPNTQPSKLHDILSRMEVEEYGSVPQREVEQQIKSLMLDLVGEDEDPMNDMGEFTDKRNDFRNELRAKINAL